MRQAALDRFDAAVGVVTNSVEFQRVFALPRRVLDLDRVEDVTSVFRRDGGTMSFWPIQSAALIEASIADGLFAPISVGAGKTLITLALPEAMNSKKTVLLVPPALKRQLSIEIETVYSRHFNLPIDRIAIVAYSELSSAKKANILEEELPDLIVADEAHSLRHKTSARTKRFLRYAKEHPECRYAFLSGTMTNRSIRDYAHLIELALRKNSPVPRGYYELKDWDGALGVKPEYQMRPGVLSKFCEEGEDVREGFRRRLVETPGVVATSKDAIGSSLLVRRVGLRPAGSIVELMDEVKKTWCIDGEELDSALEYVRVMRQLSCGFYYTWDWPDGITDYEWLEARANWHKEVRQKLKSSLEGLDSPLLLAQAAERYFKWIQKGRSGSKPEKSWDSLYWAAWREVKDRPPPPTKPVWISDFLLDQAIKWANRRIKEKTPAIIWYEHKTVGERLAEKAGLPLFDAGTDASQCREPVIVCSIRTQGTGKNLQHYSHNLFTSLPPNGTVFEQTVGRTHRPGQLSDLVVVDWFAATEFVSGAMESVLEDAEYMQKTTGQRQKVLYATRL